MLQFAMTTGIDDTALDFMLHHPAGDVGMWLRRKGAIMEAAARAEVGSSTGELRASIYRSHERIPYGHKMVIGARSRHAYFHHEGTQPHIITGRNGGVLVFTGRRGVVRTRSVRHPGTRANKFLSRQLKYLRIA